MSSWVCDYCENINSSQSICSLCHNIHNGIIIDNNTNPYPSGDNNYLPSHSRERKQWQCRFCTFLNEFDSELCEMCRNLPLEHARTERTRMITRVTRIHCVDESISPDDLERDLMRAKKIRDDIISELTNGQKFTDKEFPSTVESIGTSVNSKESQSIDTTQFISSMVQHTLSESIKWLRPEDLRGDEYSNSQLPWRIMHNPSSDDIVQGKLGNCWMLTGLALIADRPNLLDRILITKETNPYGIYQVRLCKDGIWTIVTIDDLFPANQFDQMIYSKANRKQLWVSIIEKATAKLYGSYECLTLGYCADGLAALTGFPCETIELSRLMDSHNVSLNDKSFDLSENHSQDEVHCKEMTVDTIWAMLLSAHDANFFICVSCGCSDDDSISISELNQLGLRNLHAYAILDVVDIPSVSLRLLRLKNSWAGLTWKGKWSDTHESWNTLPEVMRNNLQPLGVNGESCGVFWISLDDVLKYFFALDICRYQSDMHETRVQTHLPWPIWIDWTSEESLFQIEMTPSAVPETNTFIRSSLPSLEIEKNNTCAVLTVLESTQIQITLWQSTCRFRKNKPIDILIIICNEYKSPVGSIVASSNRQCSSFVTCDVFLDKGIYTIFYISLYYWQSAFKPDSNCKSYRQFVEMSISDLSSSLFECTLSVHSAKPVLLNRAVLTPEMIPQVISKLVIHKGEMKMFGKSKAYTLTKGYCGLIMFVLNPIDNSSIRCTCDCSGSINLKNSRSICISKSEDIISPGFGQIITVLTQDDAYSSYSLQYQYVVSSFFVKHMTEYPQLQNIINKNHWPPIQLVLHQPIRLCNL